MCNRYIIKYITICITSIEQIKLVISKIQVNNYISIANKYPKCNHYKVINQNDHSLANITHR